MFLNHQFLAGHSKLSEICRLVSERAASLQLQWGPSLQDRTQGAGEPPHAHLQSLTSFHQPAGWESENKSKGKTNRMYCAGVSIQGSLFLFWPSFLRAFQGCGPLAHSAPASHFWVLGNDEKANR